jgi:2-polyprenyl-3-methyl-5-hydroxy-6-metoxy-1,4-benzoquinol methylase
VFAMVPLDSQYVMDVGCSTGALGLSLKSAKPDRQVCGIEFDRSFASEAANCLDKVFHADLNQFNWQQALDGRTFDCIIFADVLEHLIEPQLCLKQARQHLRPGGCVVVSLPNVRHLSALRAIYVQGCFPQRDRGIFDKTHLRWFTIADAHRILADCGFNVSLMTLALRWGDLGGGRMNRLLNRLPGAVRNWAPVREFLTYQMCLRAESVA